MASGDIIEVDETGENFWIQEHRVPLLTGVSTDQMVTIQTHTYVFGKVLPSLIEALKKKESLNVNLRKLIDMDLEGITRKHLISDLLPMLGIHERLNKGNSWVLDIGCGRGTCLAEIASHFPSSFFVGIDDSLEEAVGANKRRDEKNEGLENLSFQQMELHCFKKEWNEKFDWVTIFNAYQDRPHLVVTLNEIYRILKPDGIFSTVETDSTGNVYKDKKDNEMSTMLFGLSLFGCLPSAFEDSDTAVTETILGRGKAYKLLEKVGFKQINVHSLPFMKGYLLYVCQK